MLIDKNCVFISIFFFITLISLPSFAMADRRSELEEKVRARFGDVNIGAGGRGRRRPYGMPGTVGNPDAGGRREMPILEGADGGKMNWPDVVGLTGEEAASKINAEKPGVKTAIVPNGAMVTMDHRLDRVRIYVNSEGKVEVPPRLG